MIKPLQFPLCRSVGLAIGLLVGSSISTAQEISYPVDSIRLIVPANPGGGTDTDARLFAEYLSDYTGANVAVVNQFAGGGVVAAQTVVTGEKDGSELLLYHTSIHVAKLTSTWPFGHNDFTPLATIAQFDDVVVARADAPYNTLVEFIDFAKSHPSKVTFGSQLGGTTEIKGKAIAAASDNSLRVVDAGSESDRITALLGGQVDAIPMGVNNAQQYVESGKLKVLALLNETPSPFAPDWPTTSSQGIDLSFPLVFQVYGPKGISPKAVEAIDAVIARMKQSDEVAQSFKKAKQVLSLRNSSEASDFIEKEHDFVASFFVSSLTN
ncbi:tripartite tricarboxylate transporter substrate binding protein [Kangiella sp.]|uniref:tripartite tricarboxylate transporter substrate binding protein n=1 Tax=Kangiella sp. TaxID=1920245 RepID=UPI003A8EE6CA